MVAARMQKATLPMVVKRGRCGNINNLSEFLNETRDSEIAR